MNKKREETNHPTPLSFRIPPRNKKNFRKQRGGGERGVGSVVRLCDTYNITIATNLATAELLIKVLERGDLEWRDI